MLIRLCLAAVLIGGSACAGGQPAETAAAAANNAFAVDLYRQLRTGEGNLFFSPFSLESALAMTALGAHGQTAQQMYAVLGFGEESQRLHAELGRLSARLTAPGKDRGYQLAVANALWGQQGFHFLPEFLASASQTYGAGLRQVDFVGNRELSRQTINAWVEKQTQDKIQELLKPDHITRDSVLVLTNAIYFKGDWARQFSKESTRDEPFTLADGRRINVPMMHQTGAFRYAEDERAQVLEMPYAKEELSMVVILPRKADGLAELERGLSIARLDEWLTSPRPHGEVQVAIPRFKMTAEFELDKVLGAMGMPLAFSAAADFSGISTQERLAISAVVHKAFVEVNEEGTEAAAATGVVVSRLAAAMPLIFRAEHPFLFLIREHSSGAILFMGRVSDPGAGAR